MTRILGLVLMFAAAGSAAAIELSYLVGSRLEAPATTPRDPRPARLRAINAYWSKASATYTVPGLFSPRTLTFRNTRVEVLNEGAALEDNDEEYIGSVAWALRKDTNAVLLVLAAAFAGGALAFWRWPRLGGLVCGGGMFLIALAHDPERAVPALAWVPPFVLLFFIFAPDSPAKRTDAAAAHAQAIAGRLRGRLAKAVDVELSGAYKLNMMLGMVVLVPGLLYFLNARRFPQRFDAEGVTLRDGSRYLWRDLVAVRAWQSAGGRGFLTGRNRLMLGFEDKPWIGFVDNDLEGSGYGEIFDELFTSGKRE